MKTLTEIVQAAENAMHVLLCVDSHIDDRIAAAKQIAEAIDHPWPPYPEDDDEDAC